MKWLRRVTITLSILCMVVGFFPWKEGTTKTLPDGVVESHWRFTFGIPSSPFAYIDHTDTSPSAKVTNPDGTVTWKGGGMHRETAVNFLSWSMLILLAAALLWDGPNLCQRAGRLFSRSAPG